MRTHRLYQGSVVGGLDCDGGDGTGSGLQWGRRHYWDRARGTQTRLRGWVTRLGARMGAGNGHGSAGYKHARGSWCGGRAWQGCGGG